MAKIRSMLVAIAALAVPLAAVPVAGITLAGPPPVQPEAEDDAPQTEDAAASPASPDVCAPVQQGSKRDYWHFLTACLRAMRDQWTAKGADGAARAAAADAVRGIIADTLQQGDAGYRSERGAWRGAQGWTRLSADAAAGRAGSWQVAELNTLGQPFNGMGQTGLGYFVLQFARLAEGASYPLHRTDAATYRTLGEGMLRTVVTPVRSGGLMTEAPCRADGQMRCAWYHSVTRRDRPSDFGGTLNQHLHVVRDLGLAADMYARNGWQAPFDFERAVASGLNQVLLESPRRRAGDEPDLQDFLSDPVGEGRVRWLYYGFNADQPAGAGGYFLHMRGKDCHYQVHSLDLIAQILTRARAKANWPVDRALVCGGSLAEAYRATRIRMSSPDSAQWSDPYGDRDTSCGAAEARTFQRIDAAFYQPAFARCGE